MKKKNLSKTNYALVFISVSLALLLGLSIYLGVSGWYFKNDLSYTTDLELGKTVQVDVKKNEANSISMNFDGSFLAGERLAQIISVKNSETDSNLYVRAKVFIYSSENMTEDMEIVESINWTYNINDGYYYFNSLLTASNKVTLCSYVMAGEDSHLHSRTKYIFTVLVEALDESLDVNQIWGHNPIENI